MERRAPATPVPANVVSRSPLFRSRTTVMEAATSDTLSIVRVHNAGPAARMRPEPSMAAALPSCQDQSAPNDVSTLVMAAPPAKLGSGQPLDRNRATRNWWYACELEVRVPVHDPSAGIDRDPESFAAPVGGGGCLAEQQALAGPVLIEDLHVEST